jgi:hypothetical protein
VPKNCKAQLDGVHKRYGELLLLEHTAYVKKLSEIEKRAKSDMPKKNEEAERISL